MTLQNLTLKSGAAALVILALSGCASFKTRSVSEGENQPVVQITGSEEGSKEVNANLSKPYVSPLGEIPLDVTPLTEKWVQYFQGRGRKYMEVYLQRSSRYMPMMKNTLRENGLPEDLVYVALIESGFSPIAHSHANAVGYWQFIRATGKRYGLTVDPFIDERRDPVLSTRAAAEYFKTLYDMFGSWHLSLAAYNVGENRVKRSVAKYYTRDFWELIKHRKSFPKETKHYVPKFIAAAMIAKDPAKYGFTDIEYQAPLAFDTVKLVNPVSMTRLASAMGVDVEEMKHLNPKFRGDYVPKYRGDETVIRVPVGKMEVAIAAIPAAFSEQPKVIAADHYFYRVKRGDTLSTIARRHRTSVATIRRLNNMGSRSFLRVGQKLRVPDRGGSYVAYEMPSTQDSQGSAEAEGVSDTSQQPRTVASVHVVRRGENLTLIARRYGVSVVDLRRLNNLSNRSILRVGQPLKVRLDEETEDKPQAEQRSQRQKQKSAAARMVSSTNRKSPKVTHLRHKVRRGETLAAIANRYKVSVGSIAKRNELKNRSHLLAGSELIIPKN